MDILGIGALNLDFIYDVEDCGLVKAGLPPEEGGEMRGQAIGELG